jgi:hypothetical protein
MKFDEVIADIKKLVGRRINSIRPGSDITLTKVDTNSGMLELIDSSNNRRSRPLAEIRKIWEQLCVNSAVHVDSALGGSGSSRNQPETIMANLPYVEWLIVNGKKHISFVGKQTHPLGVLRRMDPLAAQGIATNMLSAKLVMPNSIIVVDNVRSMSACLEAFSGLPPAGVSPGVYSFLFNEMSIWIATLTALGNQLECGIYLTLPSKSVSSGSKEILIEGVCFSIVKRDGVNMLFYNS